MVSQVLPSGTKITAKDLSSLWVGIREFMAHGTVPTMVKIEYPPEKKDLGNNPDYQTPSLENPDASICAVFTDHDNVIREIWFDSRAEYKRWRIENQKTKKASLGTSFFQVHQGYLNQKTKRQDLSDTLRLLAMKKGRERGREVQDLMDEGKLTLNDLLG